MIDLGVEMPEAGGGLAQYNYRGLARSKSEERVSTTLCCSDVDYCATCSMGDPPLTLQEHNDMEHVKTS